MERELKTEKDLRKILNDEFERECKQYGLGSTGYSFGPLGFKRLEPDAEGCNWPYPHCIINVPLQMSADGSLAEAVLDQIKEQKVIEIIRKVLADVRKRYNLKR